MTVWTSPTMTMIRRAFRIGGSVSEKREHPRAAGPAATGRRRRGVLILSALVGVFGSACHGSSTGPTTSSTTTTTVTPADTPAVTLTPTLLTFPTTAPGAPSVPQTVTLSNTGTAALVITSLVTTGSFTETDNCLTSLDPGATCLITVNFVPLVIGSTGAVTITDNAPTSPKP